MYPENVLEGAIFTMTPDGPVSGKGTDRLDDRDIGLECEDQGAGGQRIWHADRGLGAPTPTVHAFIFAGTGYAGEQLTLETSANDVDWDARAVHTPPDDAPQLVELVTPFAVPRYVRWHATDPAAPIRFTEAFLSPAVILTYKPAGSRLAEEELPNLVLVESAGGQDWAVQRGARRWITDYVMIYSPDADRLKITALLAATADTARPFWLRTLMNGLEWVRLIGRLRFPAADVAEAAWDIPLTFRRVLP
jgi:hypothetical protein